VSGRWVHASVGSELPTPDDQRAEARRDRLGAMRAPPANDAPCPICHGAHPARVSCDEYRVACARHRARAERMLQRDGARR
jgi:hypothetical protein